VLHFLAMLLIQRYATTSPKANHHVHLRAAKTRYLHASRKINGTL